MKKSWILWWMGNVFWFILFVIGSAFVWLREVDGSGAVQTVELKLIAFLVLLAAFIIPLLIQIVWLIMNISKNRKNKAYSS